MLPCNGSFCALRKRCPCIGKSARHFWLRHGHERGRDICGYGTGERERERELSQIAALWQRAANNKLRTCAEQRPPVGQLQPGACPSHRQQPPCQLLQVRPPVDLARIPPRGQAPPHLHPAGGLLIHPQPLRKTLPEDLPALHGLRVLVRRHLPGELEAGSVAVCQGDGERACGLGFRGGGRRWWGQRLRQSGMHPRSHRTCL